MDELALLLKLSLSTIKRLKKQPGCPTNHQNGKYKPRMWAAWVKTLNLKDYKDDGEGPKAEHLKLKNDMLKLTLEERRGRLASVDEFLEVIVPFVAEVVSKVNGLGQESSGRLFGAASVGECKKIVDDVGKKALGGFARIANGPEDPELKKKLFWKKFCMAWSERLPTLLPGPGASNTSPTPTTIEPTTPLTPSS